MQKLSLYEQLGIVIPGAFFLFGLMFYMPALQVVFAKGGFSVGGLGVFVIISYGTGHLLAALGNLVERLHWSVLGGMPSNWVLGEKPTLLSAPQIANLERLVRARLALALPPLREQSRNDWHPVFRQLYSDVERHGKPGRAETFNGTYGLNRGLSAAALALAFTVLIQDCTHWKASAILAVTSLIYLYRMHRFGVHYAREVYNQFLLLPLEPGKPKKIASSKQASDSDG